MNDVDKECLMNRLQVGGTVEADGFLALCMTCSHEIFTYYKGI